MQEMKYFIDWHNFCYLCIYSTSIYKAFTNVLKYITNLNIKIQTRRFLFETWNPARVAETLYDPFGEDDQDFELNELLNRHFKVCMTIVDENEFPELKKDIFWNQTEPEFIEHPDVNDAEKLGISEDFVFH